MITKDQYIIVFRSLVYDFTTLFSLRYTNKICLDVKKKDNKGSVYSYCIFFYNFGFFGYKRSKRYSDPFIQYLNPLD